MSHRFVTEKLIANIWDAVLVTCLFVLGLFFDILGSFLGTKTVPKATQGHLWGLMAPQGGPLSAQGCHLG